MSEKKILTIGFNIAGDNASYASYDSNVSFLDWDIVVFFPDISFYYGLTDDTFRDKPALSESYYFKLKEQAAHWRQEILNAFNASKTIIIILNELQSIYIDSGERKYSETDIRKVTRLFESYSNYDAIPLKLRPVNLAGKSIKLTKNSEMIFSYWKEFSDLSEYKVTIEEKLSAPLFLTEQEKIAGAYAKNKSSNGVIILLPYLNFNRDISFGQKFLKSIIEIDRIAKQSSDSVDRITEQPPDSNARTSTQSPDLIDKLTNQSVDIIEKTLEQSANITPIPKWTKNPLFDLPREVKLKKDLLKIGSKYEAIRKEEEAIKSKITHEGKFKRLLYEKGTALEEVILNGLRLLGFESIKYQEPESGVDMKLQSDEGIILVEVDGKDDGAIGFEKLRQLEIKILEDYSKEEVDKIAKGVLFGNTYRLQELDNRNNFFTNKCVNAAKKDRIALVRTPDLFWIVKYLSDNKDESYAKKCREAILRSEGEIVKFPEPPQVVNSLKYEENSLSYNDI
jgi:hypothetical protein